MRRDAINHPQHYNSHPSGVEAIDLCQHMDFCVGNAVKYLWRAGKKTPQQLDLSSDGALEDLKKAAWYLGRAVDNRRFGYGMFRVLPNADMLCKVIESESAGSVLRDVLELVVARFMSRDELRLADALARVRREIASKEAA